jgi:hypothetical protein
MNSNSDSSISPAAGGTAITIAVVAAIALVSIALFYLIRGPFGTFNDVCVPLVGLLAGALAWMLFPTHRFHSPTLSRFALGAALTGAGFAVGGSGLVVFKFTSWVLAGLVTTFGYGLIGLWVVALSRSTLRWPGFPRRLTTLGVVAGGVMACGLLTLPGILARADAMASTAGFVLASMYLAGLGWNVLFALWCLRLGLLLHRPHPIFAG